jgi:protein transport protein SEC31
MTAPGDRSHIPAGSLPILNILTTEMARIKARAPAQFRPQVLDTEKRLSILFDHLNNEDLLKPDTIEEMSELAQAIQGRQHDRAQQLFQDIMTTKTEQGSTWMVSFPSCTAASCRWYLVTNLSAPRLASSA